MLFRSGHVGGGGRRTAVGVAEGVGEEQSGAGPDAAARRLDRAVHLEESGGWLRGVDRGELERRKAVSARHGDRGEGEKERQEEDQAGAGGPRCHGWSWREWVEWEWSWFKQLSTLLSQNPPIYPFSRLGPHVRPLGGATSFRPTCQALGHIDIEIVYWHW